jgi:BlaI family penicillinase repressor
VEARTHKHQRSDRHTYQNNWLLKRLAQKGAITYQKEGRVFVYTPVVKEDEYLRKANDHFLNQFYNGKISSMVTNYMNSDHMEPDELNELRRLLFHGNNNNIYKN